MQVYETQGSAESLLQGLAGLPQSGKNIWKLKFLPGQGKVIEFCGWPGKFRKDFPSNFIAGRPKAALPFWFFGGFRCGVPLFIVMLVIY